MVSGEESVRKVEKRDGRIVEFDSKKIFGAIRKCVEAEGAGLGEDKIKEITEGVVERLDEKYDGHTIPNVEEIQDTVESTLMEKGFPELAKAYILYRHKRKEMRSAKSMLGVEDDLKLTFNAVKVLEKRYLVKNENGEVVETPRMMFERVAKNVASAELNYPGESDLKGLEEKFYSLMANQEFLPNSPTLMNAGTEIQQLAACFVLPVGDSMESIFESVKNTALIHKSGGGTGFSFSHLRPAGDMVKSTGGVASGPISFMRVFDVATDVVKQGGKRRGANMGILRVDHPDILDFIVCKERPDAFNNFNISVALTEKFMEAVEADESYDLINPRNNKAVESLDAKKVFDLLVTMAWKNGEPGIIFIDRINKDNPTPHIGRIESTNPCGEQPLLPYEACNLGSINLSKFVEEGKIDWDRLGEAVETAVRFLDDVIDMNQYPMPEITERVRGNRKIGLGVMGFADMLILLGVPYDSEEAVEKADKVMEFISEKAKKASSRLAEGKGTFPNFKGSVYDERGKKMRNATVTTIAPTGTISVIANCSSGVEPLFAVSFIRNVMGGTELVEVNPLFERIAKEKGFHSEELMKRVSKKGSIQHVEGIPDEIKGVFVTAHDIKPEWHVRIQAAFQKHVDNAVSKTVNFPHTATPQDIEKVYKLAYKLGCKGITVYRDKSRQSQVLNIESVNKVDAEYAGGCEKCTM